MIKVLYATTNPGKLHEVGMLLKPHNISLLPVPNIGSILETGSSLEKNATLKAEAYLPYVDEDTYVLGDDTGVFIDALNGEPGIYVRRWADHKHEMTDQAIIDLCIKKLEGVKYIDRTARMETVIAVAKKNTQTKTFSGELNGHILENPQEPKMVGFPFEALFFADEYKMLLGEIHLLTVEDKVKQKIYTHRERAILTSLIHIQNSN